MVYLYVFTPRQWGLVVGAHSDSRDLLFWELRAAGIGVTTKFQDFHDIPDSRNWAVDDFLSIPDTTHLLEIDADVSFPSGAWLRFLQHSLPVVCAKYGTKERGSRTVAKFKEGAAEQPNGLLEVERAGAGFRMVQRSVLEKLKAAHCPNRPANLHNKSVDAEGRSISDDFAFCDRWRALGGQVWLDTKVVCEHHGMIGFKPEG